MKLYMTWGAWGNLTIDSGHEMYVPVLLTEGKRLYRDVWFMYGPAAPYVTSYLYRLFGIHLSVLYWAGSLSALGSAIFLFLTGMRLSSWLAGWTAGAVLLMEAFQPSLFCFPLPYASAAVYACFVGSLFLWIVANASYSKSWVWIFGAGTAATVALLLKPEFGAACYGTLALLIAVRCFLQRSWASLARDVAAILPGILICGLVVRWMIGIAGPDFMTQENLVFWPTSYFMKTYGRMWLERGGFTISFLAFRRAFLRVVPLVGIIVALSVAFRWRRSDRLANVTKALLVLAVIFTVGLAVAVALRLIDNDDIRLFMNHEMTLPLARIFFPQDMVLYIVGACALAWCYFCWKRAAGRNLAIALALTYSSLLAFRILMKMSASGYPIFYNGPVVLSFLLLVCLIVPRFNRSWMFVFFVELILCLVCAGPVVMQTLTIEAEARDFVPLTTDRGTIRVSKHMAENYAVAIQFMKEKAARGQSVLSVPEDTSLYFLSGTYCPTRVFLFVPGLVAPGKMTDELFAEIERKPVDYLLWSNRTFSEFGVPVFGQDFDREIGDFLKSRYRREGPLIPNAASDSGWSAAVWGRKPEVELK